MIDYHVAGYDENVLCEGITIYGQYIPRELPWINGDDADSDFEVTGVYAYGSEVDLSQIPEIEAWAKMAALQRIEKDNQNV